MNYKNKEQMGVPKNQYSNFIAENPPTKFNPVSCYPQIDSTAVIGPFSSVIGDVRVKKNVFVGCNVTVRADEGTPFLIGCGSNLQDGVILHGLKEAKYRVGKDCYSIYIGNEVSIAHGAIVHGPCVIYDQVFVGFHATLLNAVIGAGCYIDLGAIVTGGIELAPNRYVPAGAVIDTREKAEALGCVSEGQVEFAAKVVDVNMALAKAYSLKFGDTHCSCGLCCDSRTLPKKEDI